MYVYDLYFHRSQRNTSPVMNAGIKLSSYCRLCYYLMIKGLSVVTSCPQTPKTHMWLLNYLHYIFLYFQGTQRTDKIIYERAYLQQRCKHCVIKVNGKQTESLWAGLAIPTRPES